MLLPGLQRVDEALRATKGSSLFEIVSHHIQTMTEAKHNRPIPKLFSNQPLASAAEVFALLREPIIFLKITGEKFIESEFYT